MTGAEVRRETGTEDGTESVDVLVIGAGVSGLCAAIRLAERGIEDVVVLEKEDGIGGTWRLNTYPGCACDVPSTAYSFSFLPNPRWSRTFAGQAEILTYLERAAERYDVQRRVRLGVRVDALQWDTGIGRWRVRTNRGEILARSVLASAGPWNEPRIPQGIGLESFDGPVFHSSRWDHTVDLAGQRVAVVGTGASAVQFVPEIAPVVDRLEIFQRTPQWVLPRRESVRSERRMRTSERHPLSHTIERATAVATLELAGLAFRRGSGQRMLRRLGVANIRAGVPDPELQRVLTPSWDVGCKRLLTSNDWYPALARDNVGVHPTALVQVDGHRLVGADGTEVEADVVILGTGFLNHEWPLAERICVGDESLATHWGGTPRAHLGTSVAGFPNLYLMLGPNTGASASAFMIVERQLDLALDAITCSATVDHGLSVRPEVQRRYNDDVQRAVRTSVYNTGGCESYHFDRNGVNSYSWPWSARRLRRIAFDPADYEPYRPAAVLATP